MEKLKQLNKELQTIQERLERTDFDVSEKLQNIIDDISNLVEARVIQKIAEELNTTIKALAESKYESVNEQPITNNNWNKMIKQSERYGAYKTLIELRRKFAEIDSNFSA